MSKYDVEYSASVSESDEETPQANTKKNTTDGYLALLQFASRNGGEDDEDGEDEGSGFSSGESSEDNTPKKVGRAPAATSTRRRAPEPVVMVRRPFRRLTEIEPGETDDQKTLRESLHKLLLKEKYTEERADLISRKFIAKKYKGSVFSPEDESELKKAEELYFGPTK